MLSLLVSPHLIDLILVLTGIEALFLVIWRRRTGQGPSMSLLLPGICLMLALRAALADAAWPWVPLALTASLVCHLADLSGRLSK